MMLGMVACAYHPSTREAEAADSQVGGQPRLNSKTLSSNKTKSKNETLIRSCIHNIAGHLYFVKVLPSDSD
jgi:hypothetical protein